VLSVAQTRSAYSPPPPYQGKASPFSTAAKVDSLANEVSRIAANDQRQDIRLYQLEREVDKAPSSPGTIEGGMAPAPQTVAYTTYQVRPGDSLWRIANNHRVSPGQIMAFNRMSNDTVVAGQVLMIPLSGTPSNAAPPPAASHTVQDGETYYSIAKKHGITVSALEKANPKVNPNRLRAGTKLALPARSSKAKTTGVAYDYGLPAPVKKPAPAPPPAPAKSHTHAVKAGESLSVIAQSHGVSTASLQRANNLANANSLRVGQVLVIPGSSAAAPSTKKKPVVVAKNTTLAPKGTSTTSPKSSKVPPAGAGTVKPPPFPPTPPAVPVRPEPPAPPPSHRGIVAYRMDRGDTLESVASMFGTTTAEIRRINKLSSTASLKSGDEILVPGMGPVGN
jgi:LysM repeat protein